MSDDRLVRNISDTALWVAHYRAVESERPDAHFRDPFARALAGERGERIAKSQQFGDRNSWAFIARTVVIDRLVAAHVAAGTDLVLNLAAGLDTRPYRMELPASLRWVEVDLPAILDYKEAIIGSAVPRCRLERVRLDLADEAARRAFFAQAGSEGSRVLVLTEGLLLYLSAGQVDAFARDLHREATFHTWVTDIASPGLLQMMARRGGQAVADAGAPFKFAPPGGADYFRSFGWTPTRVESLLKAARPLNRLSWLMRMMAALPEDPKRRPDRPWSAIVELQRAP